MTGKRYQPVFIFLLLAFLGCANLEDLAKLSDSSLDALEKIEEIDYSFEQACLEACTDKYVHEITLENDCVCDNDRLADSVTLLLYHQVRGYLRGISRLSQGELTDYVTDSLTRPLKEIRFGDAALNKEQVDAYAAIGRILTKATTDGYRKRKLAQYLKEADAPVSVLLKYLRLNVAVSLAGKVEVRQQRIQNITFDRLNKGRLSDNEKRDVLAAYYAKRIELTERIRTLRTYGKTLAVIEQAHHRLALDADKLDASELRSMILLYKSNIDDILSEFDKVKR